MSAADSPTSGRGGAPHLESGPIANHRLLGEIGRGRTSVVYLAAAKRSHGYMVFALKHLRAELRGDRAAVSAFVDAARIARRLDHPNLVHTVDVVVDPGRYLLGMEFVDGQPFERVVRRARKVGPAVPLRMHLRVITEVLAALEYLHSSGGLDRTPGLAHREVGPEKVHIAYDGRVKVLGRADVFAVGMMLKEAILWNQPASAEPGGSGEGPLRDGGEAPDADPALLAIARRATEGDPGARYPTAGAMRMALEEYAASSGLVLPDVRDLSLSVSALFAQERLKQQAVIRTRLAALEDTRDTGDSPGMLPRIVLTPSAPLVLPVRLSSRPPRPPAALPLTAPPVAAPSLPPAARPPAWSSALGQGIVASVAAIIAAGGAAWLVTSRSAPPVEARGLARSQATAVASGTVPAAPSAGPALPVTTAPAPESPPPAPPAIAPVPVVSAPPVVRAYPTPHAVARATPTPTPAPTPTPTPTPTPAPAPAPAPTPAAPAPPLAPAASPIAAPPPKPGRAIHRDNPYLP